MPSLNRSIAVGIVVAFGGLAMAKNPNPIDKYVGNRVRMRRLMLHMSQGKLADAIGLTFQQVQKYEKGTNRMGSSRLLQIANFLQVPITFFFEGSPGQSKLDDKAPSPAYVSEFLSTTDGLSLVRAFVRIKSTKLRRGVVNLVELMAGEA
jgi:transcriptional regulator with XRE-family HTH domain